MKPEYKDIDAFYKHLNYCLCCHCTDLELILDLGHQPLANNYQESDKFPLQLMGCPICTHAQLSIAVDPDILFSDYPYVSGTTDTLKKYFNDFAVDCITRYNPKSVLDIGCNDGSQLNAFKNINPAIKTYGVDPAENLIDLARSGGHTIYCGFFEQGIYDVFHAIPIDLIIAQNVFAHNSSPKNFLRHALDILSPDGTILIQTSQANMFNRNEFDTIYHEHISFFSEKSMRTLCDQLNAEIIYTDITDIHGGSFVFHIKRKQYRTSVTPWSVSGFRDYALNFKSELNKSIEFYKKKGFKIVGYGAAAKGVVVINFADLKLDFVIDDNERKIGHNIPGTTIPINHYSVLLSEPKAKYLFVLLAWNFKDEIRSRIKRIRNNPEDLFLTYFPKIQLFS